MTTHTTPIFRSKKFRSALTFLLLFILPAGVFAGGENKIGTNAASELLIPVGARDIGMAGASIATSSGLDALYWNPAGLARSEHAFNAMFSHMNYIADIGIEYAAASLAFEGFGAVGLSIKSVGIGDIAVTTEDQPDGTGQVINPTILTLGMSYARFLTDRITVGGTVTVMSEQLDRVSATGVAFSGGIQHNGLAGVSGLSVGVAVKNLGPRMRFSGDGLLQQKSGEDPLHPGSLYTVDAGTFDLPSTIEIGLAYAYAVAENNTVALSGVFQNNNFSADEYKVGVEYSYARMFFLRSGYTFAESTKQAAVQSAVAGETSIFGFTAGAGVRYATGSLDVSFDYAFRSVKYLENNHVFTMGIGF